MKKHQKPELSMVGKSRKIDRNIARARMRRAGIVHPNREPYAVENGMLVKKPSYFAVHWRAVAAMKIKA